MIMLAIKEEKTISIPRSSEWYPKEWEALPDAPSTLYAYGNIELLKERKFVIVGARRTPKNILKLGADIAKSISKSFVVVTGCAEGGDSAAIEGALSSGGRIICLLPGGFSALPQGLPLLEQVAKRGLLLSPHPFETEIRTFSYGYRNKLLAALGEGTLVLAAGEKSGTLITAKFAKKFGKRVFAIPYPPFSDVGAGCNALIKNGAFLTENAEDIANKFGIVLEEEKEMILTDSERNIYGYLQQEGEGHVTEMALALGVPAFKLTGSLSALEMKGCIVSLGGNRYGIVKK